MGLRGQQLTVNYAYRQFADEIEDQIMQGTLKPGERLPGEIALAEMFGVTRSTVREGLRQLESEGLVCRPTPRRLEVARPQSDKLSSRSSRSSRSSCSSASGQPFLPCQLLQLLQP